VLEATARRHPTIQAVQMDVCVDADRRRTIEHVHGKTGRIDVLINNALAIDASPFETQSSQAVSSMFETLVEAPIELIRLCLPYLRASKGSVINMSSVAGHAVPMPPMGLTVYASAKGGINQLTRTLASEIGPDGIRVNAIAPGPTDSEESRRVGESNPGMWQPIIDATPLRRLGQPSDIARVALFLASDAGGWVTGQVIDASGGWYLGA
jgi:NAD(P)-dependent dehydrogenase (short-subunit alcohol dehydrogenase family)